MNTDEDDEFWTGELEAFVHREFYRTRFYDRAIKILQEIHAASPNEKIANLFHEIDTDTEEEELS